MALTLRVSGRTYRLERGSDGARVASDAVLRALHDHGPRARHALLELLDNPTQDARSLGELDLNQRIGNAIKAGRLRLVEVPQARGQQLVSNQPAQVAPSPSSSSTSTAAVQKYKLVELVEVVDRGGLGTVAGAAKGSAKLPKHLDRADKDGGDYKQYINLGQDIDGAANRHPEYGRVVKLRARIEWTSGNKSNSLAGHTIKWKLVVTKQPGAGRPASFQVDAEKEALNGIVNVVDATSTTNSDGWADMNLRLSQYAGDKFSISADVDARDAQAQAGAAITAGAWVVWRKFWYQITRDSGATIPTPTDAINAYKAICADMVATDEVTYTKADKPGDRNPTYLQRGMLKLGSSDTTEVVVIGSHNQGWFKKKFRPEPGKPVKGHLIMCEAMWEQESDMSSLQTFDMNATAQDFSIDIGGGYDAGILTPSFEPMFPVLDGSKWRIAPSMKAKYDAASRAGRTDPSLPPAPAAFEGRLADSALSIPLPRSAMNKIRITLPDGCPDPTRYKIQVQLTMFYCRSKAGLSEGTDMFISYPPGEDKALTQVVAHEFGHSFMQTPAKPDKRNSISLPAHAKQYDQTDNHGGLGPHCSTGARVGAVDVLASKGFYLDGTCIMLHYVSPQTCSQTFCATCEPHIRLQPFDRFKK